MHITIDQGYQSSINIDPLIENFGSKAVADSDKSLEKSPFLYQSRLLSLNGNLGNLPLGNVFFSYIL